LKGGDVEPLHEDLAAFQSAEWERLSGHSARDAAQLHGAFGHVLRGYRYLELVHERHVPTAKRYKELLALLFTKMDPAFDGGAITYDDEMATMDAEMADLLDIAHLDLETFYLFAKTVLDRVAQYVELYFGPEPKLPVRAHEKLYANFSEYATRRGIVVPDGFTQAVRDVQDMIFTHQPESATNDARVAQSPSDLMIAHTDERPGGETQPESGAHAAQAQSARTANTARVHGTGRIFELFARARSAGFYFLKTIVTVVPSFDSIETASASARMIRKPKPRRECVSASADMRPLPRSRTCSAMTLCSVQQ
jgi:hypothetical protein